jgi:hypothetical protein
MGFNSFSRRGVKDIETPLCVTADNVSALRAEHIDPGLTVLASLGIATGAALVAGVLVASVLLGGDGLRMSLPRNLSS